MELNNIDIKNLLLKRKNKIVFYSVENDSDINQIAKILNCRIDVLIVDYKNLADNKILKFLNGIRQLCSIFETLFLIKNRADLARLSDADGIFCDKNSYSLANIRKILNNDKIFGLYYDENIEEDVLKTICEFDFIVSRTPLNTNIPTFFDSAFVESNVSKIYIDFKNTQNGFELINGNEQNEPN